LALSPLAPFDSELAAAQFERRRDQRRARAAGERLAQAALAYPHLQPVATYSVVVRTANLAGLSPKAIS